MDASTLHIISGILLSVSSGITTDDKQFDKHCSVNVTANHMTCSTVIPTTIPKNITSIELRGISYTPTIPGRWSLNTIYNWPNVDSLRHEGNTFIGSLPWFVLTKERLCHLIYSRCYFLNKNMHDDDKFTESLTSFKFFGTNSMSEVEISDTIMVQHLFILPPITLTMYNVTKLLLRNVTCPSGSVYITLPESIKVFDALYVSCPIRFQVKMSSHYSILHTKFQSWFYININEINVTGSDNIAMEILKQCSDKGVFNMKYLVSLDISDIFLSSDKTPVQRIGHTCRLFMPKLTKVYARNVIAYTSTTYSCSTCIYVKHYTYQSCIQVNSSKCFKEFYIICLNPKTVELLNLAGNKIAYIHLSVSESFISLKILDISKNSIHVMNGGANIYLGSLTGLQEIYLSSNKLQILSTDVLSALSNLTVIDLSNNMLNSLTFRVQHLYQLRVLTLCNNNIKFIETSAMTELSSLESYQQIHSNTTFQLDLLDNPLVCSCSSKSFVEWILGHDSMLRHWPLSCHLNLDTRVIDYHALLSVKELCKQPFYIIIASVVSVITLAVIAISSVYCYIHVKHLHKEQHILNLIQNFNQENDLERFPVFLSFCSTNSDFVLDNIYVQLNDRLQDLLNVRRRCVAFGDANFRPGCMLIEEMVRCLSKCDVVILCVSNDYLRSAWCTDEVRIAHNLRKPILLIFLEEVDKKLLSKSILLLYYNTKCRTKIIQTGDTYELLPDWHTFCKAVISHFSDNEEAETRL